MLAKDSSEVATPSWLACAFLRRPFGFYHHHWACAPGRHLCCFWDHLDSRCVVDYWTRLSATIQESTAGILFRQTALASVSPPSPSPSSLPPAPDKSLTDAEAHYLVFFERMFLELDEDSSGYLSNEDVDGVLSFVALVSFDSRNRLESQRSVIAATQHHEEQRRIDIFRAEHRCTCHPMCIQLP